MEKTERKFFHGRKLVMKVNSAPMITIRSSTSLQTMEQEVAKILFMFFIICYHVSKTLNVKNFAAPASLSFFLSCKFIFAREVPQNLVD